MTVKELIKLLQTFPPTLSVVYELHSEHALLETTDIQIKTLGPTRPDGWVANERSNHDLFSYLVFPGN